MSSWRITMLALAEGWARQSGLPLSSVVAKLARIVGGRELRDPTASALQDLEKFRVGNAYVGELKIASVLADSWRHLESGTEAGEVLARNALAAIWVSAETVRAYCRTKRVVPPDCIRRHTQAIEHVDAIHMAPETEFSVYEPSFVAAELSTNARSAPTAVAERDCFRWLFTLMRANPDAPRRKHDVLEQALVLFPRLSRNGFTRAWANAVAHSGATRWSGAGRKPRER
jgi:hypothetical protein